MLHHAPTCIKIIFEPTHTAPEVYQLILIIIFKILVVILIKTLIAISNWCEIIALFINILRMIVLIG